MSGTLALLSSRPLPADELPSSFLILRYGRNPNFNADAKGEPHPLFTRRSAAKIMADFARRGADLPADLEHRSLAKGGAADATDAMGWFRLELRADGLYASQVRWTPEGARRLRAKSQRYVSPVFYFDRETGEVTEFVNVALTSDPATYHAAPLVAASRAPAPRVRLAVVGAKLPAELKIAFAVLAHKQGLTVSAGLRRLVERADAEMLARTAPRDLVRLCQLLSIPKTSTPDEIRDALEEFLAELPPDSPAATVTDAPADPTAATADPPQPDPLSRELAARRDAMNPIERDRFDRYRASMALGRAAQLRPRNAAARPPFSPAVRAKLATMTREQRARFDTMISNRRK